MCGVASQNSWRYIGQVHRIFNRWTMLCNELPGHAILRILSFISFHLVRRTISYVCKKWNRISEDPSLVWRFLGSTWCHDQALRRSG